MKEATALQETGSCSCWSGGRLGGVVGGGGGCWWEVVLVALVVGGSIGGGCWWEVVVVAATDTQLPAFQEKALGIGKEAVLSAALLKCSRC